MAGIIVADTIQSGGDFIRLNSASQTVATINASGIYANTGNLLIAANGTIGVATISNTAITGTMTQAQIGTNVAGTGPTFRAFRSTNQNISSNVWTKINFNSESFDTNNNFDSSTNFRFTPTVAGYYHLYGYSLIAGTGITFIAMEIYKNGSSVTSALGDYANISSQTQWGSKVSDLVYANGTTDYFEVYGYATGTSLYFYGGSAYTFFTGHLVRAA